MTKGPFPFVVDAYFIIRNLIDNKKNRKLKNVCIDANLTIMYDKKSLMGHNLSKKFYHKFKNIDFDL